MTTSARTSAGRWIGAATFALVGLTVACEKEDAMRPPPATCNDPACGAVPPATPGGGGRNRDGGATAADSGDDAGAPDAAIPVDQLTGTVVQVRDIVARSGAALSGAIVSIEGSRSATSDASGRFVIESVVARPPIYVSIEPTGAVVASTTLVTARVDARVFAIDQGTLVDEAAALGASHAGTAGALFIRVVDSTGVPRDGAVVSTPPVGIGPFYDLAGSFERSAILTDVAGAIAFFEVPPGRPSVCVRDATETAETCAQIPIAVGATFTTIVLP